MVYLIQDANFLINIFSEKLAKEMTSAGVPTQFIRVGSKTCEKLCRRLFSIKRCYIAIFPFINMQITKHQIKKIIKPGDVFIIYEIGSTISQFSDCSVHKMIHRYGAKVISLIPDAWNLSYSNLQKGLFNRSVNSDVLAAVTPSLQDSLKKMFPQKKIILMEESIDYDEFLFVEQKINEPPIIVWSGPNLLEIKKIDEVLCKLDKDVPFRLRVVTGKVKPNLDLKNKWDWMPFVGTSYKEQFLGASIGFAWYERNPYSECKGNYKIKTYLAAGCAVVTSKTAYNHILLDSGRNGVLVDSEDGLVEVFRTLLTNHTKREHNRRNARKFVLEKYSIQATAKKYVDCLRLLGFVDLR